MTEYINKAKTLIEALPYIKEFSGITVVIKYGGSALGNDEIKTSVMQDIALMKLVGFHPVVVHGGGPEINNTLGRLDIKSKFINGLRVTDDETMEVVEMVLTGKINKQLTTDLCMQGISVCGISGKDGSTLVAEKMLSDGQDIGRVGNVKHVNTALLRTLIQNDFVPVISPVGVDEHGNSYNINADYAAVSIAGALKAEKLIFLTDVEGIRRDINDSKSVFSHIRVAQIKEMIANGTITGGFLPKVTCCMAGVEAGVQHVHILDGRVEHCLLLEIFTNKGIGTLIEA